MFPQFVCIEESDTLVPKKWNHHWHLVAIYIAMDRIADMHPLVIYHTAIRPIIRSACRDTTDALLTALEECNVDFGVMFNFQMTHSPLVIISVVLLLDDLGVVIAKMAS